MGHRISFSAFQEDGSVVCDGPTGDKMAVETTEEHLKVFSEACLKYQKEFGLTNWELHFAIKEIDYQTQNEYNLPGYVATIYLGKKWEDELITLTDEEIDNCARHEMLHLLIGRLTSYALWRFIEKDTIMEADEEIIRRLEYIFDHKE